MLLDSDDDSITGNSGVRGWEVAMVRGVVGVDNSSEDELLMESVSRSDEECENAPREDDDTLVAAVMSSPLEEEGEEEEDIAVVAGAAADWFHRRCISASASRRIMTCMYLKSWLRPRWP